MLELKPRSHPIESWKEVFIEAYWILCSYLGLVEMARIIDML